MSSLLLSGSTSLGSFARSYPDFFSGFVVAPKAKDPPRLTAGVASDEGRGTSPGKVFQLGGGGGTDGSGGGGRSSRKSEVSAADGKAGGEDGGEDHSEDYKQKN